MAGHGGGAWKVAYADFVTAMMAFFLVMWITAQSNAVKQAVARYFEHPFDAASRSAVPADGKTGASLVPMHRDMNGNPPHSTSKGKAAFGGGLPPDHEPAANNANQPRSGGLRRRSGFMLREDDPSGMGNEIIFAGDSSQLDDRAKESLDEMLPLLSGKRNKVEIRSIMSATTVNAKESEATAQASSEASKSWQTSYDRCQAIMNYLVKLGVEPSRFRLSQTTAVEPPKSSSDADALGRDSRVQVYMLSEYADEFLDLSSHGERDQQSAAIVQGATADTASAPANPPAAEKPSDETPLENSQIEKPPSVEKSRGKLATPPGI